MASILEAADIVGAVMNSVDVVEEFRFAQRCSTPVNMQIIDKSRALHPEHRQLGLLGSIRDQNNALIEYYLSTLDDVDINADDYHFLSPSLGYHKVSWIATINLRTNIMCIIIVDYAREICDDDGSHERNVGHLQTVGGTRRGFPRPSKKCMK